MTKQKTGSDKTRICLACGNNTWKEVQEQREKKRDFHFHISQSTKNLLKERVSRYGTFDAGFRAIINDYDLFLAMQQRDSIRQSVYQIRGMDMEEERR
jgi:hypothetical protein